MLSYFAIIGKTGKSATLVSSLADRIRLEHSSYRIERKWRNFCLLISGNEDELIKKYSLSGNMGLILGTVFQKNEDAIGVPAQKQFDFNESRKIVKTSGAYLTSNYWGQYLAFIHDEKAGKHSILRDPSGAFPGHYYETDDLVIFFMDIEHFLKLNFQIFTVNRNHIATAAKYPFIDQKDPALQELKKIMAGQALDVENGKTRHTTHWHPAQFCQDFAYADPETAKRDLRKVVEGTIHAWASQLDNILLFFSGGFDSTIILSCLISAPSKPNVVCLHYYSENVGEDDRDYARAAASHFGVEMIEERGDGNRVNMAHLFDFYLDPDPRVWGHSFIDSGYAKQIATSKGLNVLMSGQGGDEIFYNRLKHAAAEYISRNGLTKDFFRQASAIAQAENQSYLSVVIEGIKSLIRKPLCSVDSVMDAYPSQLMPAAVFDETKIDDQLSWIYEPLGHAPASKIHQIIFSHPCEGYRIPNNPEWDLPFLRPLYSQPVLELIYRIPSYLFAYKGVRRGLARAAFIDAAPQKNILRQSKAGAESHIKNLIHKNKKFLLPLLKESILVEMGIWKNDFIDKLIRNDPTLSNQACGEFISHLSIELWLQKMKNLGVHGIHSESGS